MSETTAIAVLGERALVPAEVFKAGGVRLILDQIKAEVAGEKIDVSTPAGREHCRSLAFKIARSKTALDGMGKTLSDEWRKRAEAIHAERRLIEKELDALRDQVRAPLTAYEEREKNRVAAHEEALMALGDLVHVPDDQTIEQIDDALATASRLVTTRAWEEFQMRASDLFALVNDSLNDFRVRVIQRDKDRAEAARLQAEREEEARLYAIREQQAREARLQAEAAEKARQQAIREEQERHAEELEAVHQAQVAREKVAEEATRATIRRAEAAARAEAQEQARLEYEAQRAKVEAAAVQRAKEAEELAAKQREANIAHQRKINREAGDAIEMVIVRDDRQNTQALATAIVTALAKGAIPHCKVIY